MRTQVGQVTTTGANGAATGSVAVGTQPSELVAIQLKYAGGVPGTTKVVVKNGTQTLLEVVSATEETYYVRAQSHNSKGEHIAVGEGRWNSPVVNGDIKIEVTLSNAAANAVTAVLFFESP